MVVVKNGTRICGSGGVLCTAPIVQNKCYFEVKVQQSGKWNSCVQMVIVLPKFKHNFFFLFKCQCTRIGIWGVGVALNDVDLYKAPGGHDPYSWVLCNDGAQRHNQQVLKAIDNNIEEGDIIVSIVTRMTWEIFEGCLNCLLS